MAKPRGRVVTIVLFVALTLPILAGLWFWRGPILTKGRKAAGRCGLPWPSVIAHRGASWWAPEATAPAYRLALELGADYLELDVQRTADGVLIAFHDDTLERTTNVGQVVPKRAGSPVGSFTLAELKRLDAGSWFNRERPDRARREFVGLPILTLAEVVEIAGRDPGGPGLYIETKGPSRYPGIERELVKLLAKAGWPGKATSSKPRVVIQSFDLASLKRVRALAPRIPRSYLVGRSGVSASGFRIKLSEARSVEACVLGPNHLLVWPWRAVSAHRAGLALHPYTVNSRFTMRLLQLLGADGFFTDRPDLLLTHYGRPSRTGPAELLSRLPAAQTARPKR